MREGRVAPVPTITFEESLDIDLGGVKVVLHYFGPVIRKRAAKSPGRP